MSGPRALRWSVPIGPPAMPTGPVHELVAPVGNVVHVDCRQADEVDLWIVGFADARHIPRRFIVTGTGQYTPAGAWHVGTALSPQTPLMPYGALVWHLWELPVPGVSGA